MLFDYFLHIRGKRKDLKSRQENENCSSWLFDPQRLDPRLISVPILHGSKTIDPDGGARSVLIDRQSCVCTEEQRKGSRERPTSRNALDLQNAQQELNEPRQKEEEEENKRDSSKASGGKKKTGGSFRTRLNPVMQRWKSTMMRLHTFPHTTGDFFK